MSYIFLCTMQTVCILPPTSSSPQSTILYCDSLVRVQYIVAGSGVLSLVHVPVQVRSIPYSICHCQSDLRFKSVFGASTRVQLYCAMYWCTGLKCSSTGSDGVFRWFCVKSERLAIIILEYYRADVPVAHSLCGHTEVGHARYSVLEYMYVLYIVHTGSTVHVVVYWNLEG